MPIIFEVRFISPLLMGGIDSRDLDGLGLRGNSLRGCWRFWLRALVGGMVYLPTPEQLLALENDIFGATAKPVFRLRVDRVIANRENFVRLPHRSGGQAAPKPGYQEGAVFRVTILTRPGAMALDQMNVLLGSIWLWGYLGAIGNRSRRGFGSPVLAPVAGQSDSFAAVDLNLSQQFDDSATLSQYLQQGIERCWQLFQPWLTGHGYTPRRVTALTDPTAALGTYEFFTVKTLNQVAVSTLSFTDLGCLKSAPNPAGAIKHIHGDPTAQPELGRVWGGRLASPAYIRLHNVNNEWVPVCTWSKFAGIPDLGRAATYLRSIGFSNSLLGAPW